MMRQHAMEMEIATWRAYVSVLETLLVIRVFFAQQAITQVIAANVCTSLPF